MKALLPAVSFLAVALFQTPDGRPQEAARPAPPPPAPTATTRRPPQIAIEPAEGQAGEAITVTRMDVQAVVKGFLAETTVTLTLANGGGRPLAGELVFPVPEGAAISGYALDVNGEMVDGVVVEHHEARIAFEKEVRRRVDPGLVEWAAGNNFRTRVWPIPAQGARSVRVRYVSRLALRGAGREAVYVLPLATRDRVAELTLRVEVDHTSEKPQVRSEAPAGFAFGRWEDRYVAQARLRDFQPEQDLVVALPRLAEPVAALETDEDGRVYFAIDGALDLPAPVSPLPARRVGLYWDASLSRDSADRERDLRVLERWLRRASAAQVDAVVFRDVPEAPRTFSIAGGETAALLDFLRRAPCDGATSLAALRFPSGHDYDVLVSDGLADLGGEPPRPGAPLYVLNGDSRSNHPLLDHLARASGGLYLNLQATGEDDAASAIGALVPRLVSLDYDASQLADVRPPAPSALRERLTVSGRLLVPEARLTLRYGVGEATRTRTFVLRQSEAAAGRLVPRLWAEARIAELSVAPERNHDELLGLGRRFGIVTPGASLIVFERLEQYVEHHIEPPRSLPRLREAYLGQIGSNERRLAAKRGDKLEQVVAMWDARVAWWRREFPKSAAVSRQDEKSGRPREEALDRAVAGGVEGGVPGGVVGGVVGGLPAAPPPAPSPAGAGGALRATVPVMVPAEAKTVASSESTSPPPTSATIVIKAWDPDTPYLRVLRAVPPPEAYAVFLRERREYGTSPAFYLDCAEQLANAGQRALALRVLTDVIELQLAEPRLLRIAAHRLQQMSELDLAIELFEEVLRLRPEEPQSLRDLALALAARAEERLAGRSVPAASAADFQRALELLNRIVTAEWDGRFPQIEVIALEEANRIASIVERHPALRSAVTNPLDLRLRQPLTLDLRVVLTWDTDLTDMDLWVTEPSGERCYYSHALTSVGGAISRDFTQGYGPEVYATHRALPGRYKIQTNFYGSGAQSLTGPTTVQATVITNFGLPNEKRRALTLRLTERKDVVDVGEVTIEGSVTDGPASPR
jgi:Ca-activated chloride channel family protein